MKKLYLLFTLLLLTVNVNAQCSFGEIEYNLFVNSSDSQYPTENSWQLLDLNGNVVESIECEYYNGQNETYSFCLNIGDTYTFEAIDDWGDGWNGGWFEFTNSSGCVVIPAMYPDNGLAGNNALNCTNMDIELELAFEAGAPIMGCTNPDADNYNPCAEIDDGACFTCGNGVCELGESYESCPEDCPCTFELEWVDYYAAEPSDFPVPICGFDETFPFPIADDAFIVPFTTLFGEDEEFTVETSVGTVFLDLMTTSTLNFVEITNVDIFQAAGNVNITLTSVSNTDCSGTLVLDFTDIGVNNSVSDFCSCGQIVWVDNIIESATSSPQIECSSELESLIIPIGVVSPSESNFTLTLSNGYFLESGESSIITSVFQTMEDVVNVVVSQEDIVNTMGLINITAIGFTDESCNGDISLNLSFIEDLQQYCNFVDYNDCVNAVNLELGTNGPFSNVNATVGEEDIFVENCFYDNDEYQATVYFTFTGTGDYMNIVTDPFCEGIEQMNDDTQFVILDACGGEVIACNEDAYLYDNVPFAAAVGFMSEADVEYTLLVDGWSGTEGEFCINVESACFTEINWSTLGGGFQQQPNFSCNGLDEILIPFTVYSSVNELELSYNYGIVTNNNGEEIQSVQTSIDESEVYFLHLTQEDIDADDILNLEVYGVSELGAECYSALELDLATLNLEVEVFCQPPSNDECANAIALEFGYNEVFTNQNAVVSDTDFFDGGCYIGGEPLQATVFFTFYGTGAELEVITDTTGANFEDPITDTQLVIFEGDCTSTNVVACNDDMQGSWNSRVTFQSEEGQLYTIMVDGYGGEQGDFYVSIEEVCNVEMPPTISLSQTEFGWCEEIVFDINIENAGDGFGVVFIITDETSTYILEGPFGNTAYSSYGYLNMALNVYAISFDFLDEPTSNLIADLTGCFKLSEPVNFFVDDCESIENIDGTPIKIYPSITKGDVFIDMNLADFVNLKVYDVAGKVVHSEKAKSFTHLELSDLSSGSYIIRLSDGKNQLSKKIVKQ